MIFAKQFFTAALSFAILDFIWLGYVMKDFNLRHLSEIGRIENGTFNILYAPALLVYVFMALAVVLFVLPRTSEESFLMSFFWGALMGLFVYGVYDLTNMAILKNYPLNFALADMAWGTFVFGVVTLLTKKLITNT
jgi:uncharacterized membrane protein